MLRIRYILLRVPLTNGYPTDLALDPNIFVIDLQDANKNYFFLIFFAYYRYFSKVYLHHFSKSESFSLGLEHRVLIHPSLPLGAAKAGRN